MKHAPDDPQIRELVQRVKRADEEQAPDFGSVLERPRAEPSRQTLFRLPLLIAGCAAVLSIGWFFRRPPDDGNADPGPQIVLTIDTSEEPAKPSGTDVDIDFDQLRDLVSRHLRETAEYGGHRVPVWSSRTESLLALNFDLSQAEE